MDELSFLDDLEKRNNKQPKNSLGETVVSSTDNVNAPMMKQPGVVIAPWATQQQPQQEETGYFDAAKRGAKAQAAGAVGGQADFVSGTLGTDGAVGDYMQNIMRENSRKRDYNWQSIVSNPMQYALDPEGLAYDVGGGFGSSGVLGLEGLAIASALPAGVTAGIGTGIAAAAARLGIPWLGKVMASPAGKMLIGNVLKTPLEGASEGGNVYREMTHDEYGNPIQDADKAAARKAMYTDAALNSALLTFTNSLESMGLGSLIAGAGGKNVFARIMKGAVGDFLQNGYEEGAQQGINAYSQNKGTLGQIVNPFQWNDEQRTEGLIGGLTGFGQGAIMTGGGMAANKVFGQQQPEETEQPTQATVPEEEKPQLDEWRGLQSPHQYLNKKAGSKKTSDADKRAIQGVLESGNDEEILALATRLGFKDGRIDQERGSFIDAIASQESGGDYSLINPDSGAIGKYQIMPENWSAWAEEAGLGADAEPTPENQERVAQFKLGQYFDKYGARGAAIAWYAGEGALDYSDDALNRKQGDYPSINEYAESVLSRMGEGFRGYEGNSSSASQGEPTGATEAGTSDIYNTILDEMEKERQQQQNPFEEKPAEQAQETTAEEQTATQEEDAQENAQQQPQQDIVDAILDRMQGKQFLAPQDGIAINRRSWNRQPGKKVSIKAPLTNEQIAEILKQAKTAKVQSLISKARNNIAASKQRALDYEWMMMEHEKNTKGYSDADVRSNPSPDVIQAANNEQMQAVTQRAMAGDHAAQQTFDGYGKDAKAFLMQRELQDLENQAAEQNAAPAGVQTEGWLSNIYDSLDDKYGGNLFSEIKRRIAERRKARGEAVETTTVPAENGGIIGENTNEPTQGDNENTQPEQTQGEQGETNQGEENQSPVVNGEVRGNEVTVVTDKGTEIKATYKLIDADKIITSNKPNDTFDKNPDYPEELQPRDRATATMRQQVLRMSKTLRPADLAASRNLNAGAPVVNGKNIVLNGNGRAMAIFRALKGKNQSGADYKAYMQAHAEEFGFTIDQVNAIKNPILVREVADNVDVQEIINSTAGGAKMGAREQAKADAKRLTLKTLKLYKENDDADITTAENSEFTLEALTDITGNDPNELNDLVTPDGKHISQAGVIRIKNALFAKAYNDDNIISAMSEATDTNIKNVIKGLLNASPKIAEVKANAEEGTLYDVKFEEPVLEACKKMMALRSEGKPVSVFLKEQSMFGEDISDNAKKILEFFDKNKQKPKKIATMLTNMATQVESYGHPNQGTLFGESKAPTMDEVVDNAIKYAGGEMQGGLFDGGEETTATGEGTQGGAEETTDTTEKPGENEGGSVWGDNPDSTLDGILGGKKTEEITKAYSKEEADKFIVNKIREANGNVWNGVTVDVPYGVVEYLLSYKDDVEIQDGRDYTIWYDAKKSSLLDAMKKSKEDAQLELKRNKGTNYLYGDLRYSDKTSGFRTSIDVDMLRDIYDEIFGEKVPDNTDKPNIGYSFKDVKNDAGRELVEVHFDGKPATWLRNIMKETKMQWNPAAKAWWAFKDNYAAMELLKKWGYGKEKAAGGSETWGDNPDGTLDDILGGQKDNGGKEKPSSGSKNGGKKQTDAAKEERKKKAAQRLADILKNKNKGAHANISFKVENSKAKFDEDIFAVGCTLGYETISDYDNYADWAEDMLQTITDAAGEESAEQLKPFLGMLYKGVSSLPKNFSLDENIFKGLASFVGSRYEKGMTDYKDVVKAFEDKYGQANSVKYADYIKAAFNGVDEFYNKTLDAVEAVTNEGTTEDTTEGTEGTTEEPTTTATPKPIVQATEEERQKEKEAKRKEKAKKSSHLIALNTLRQLFEASGIKVVVDLEELKAACRDNGMVVINGEEATEENAPLIVRSFAGQGELYGMMNPKTGTMYLDPNCDLDTPVHEYTHLWNKTIQVTNPKLWARGVELAKQSPLWHQISTDPYYSIWAGGDEQKIADEVIARICGPEGERILQDMAIGESAPEGLIKKLKNWVKQFWQMLKDTFVAWGNDDVADLTEEEFAKMPLKALLDGVDVLKLRQEAELGLYDNTDNGKTKEEAQKEADKNKPKGDEEDDSDNANGNAGQDSAGGQTDNEDGQANGKPRANGSDGEGNSTPQGEGNNGEGSDGVPGSGPSAGGEEAVSQGEDGDASAGNSTTRDTVDATSDNPGFTGEPTADESGVEETLGVIENGRADGETQGLNEEEKEYRALLPDDEKGIFDKVVKKMPFLSLLQKGNIVAWIKRTVNNGLSSLLLTDGTGTGKTYSGLAAAKDVLSRKDARVLVVTPSQSICKQWIAAAQNKEHFDIQNSAILDNTNDSGKEFAGKKGGFYTTTYANFQANMAMFEKNWDLVIVDESHHLNSAGNGMSTGYLNNLRALTFHSRGLEDRADILYATPEEKKARAEYTDVKNAAGNYYTKLSRLESKHKKYGDYPSTIDFLKHSVYVAEAKAVMPSKDYIHGTDDEKAQDIQGFYSWVNEQVSKGKINNKEKQALINKYKPMFEGAENQWADDGSPVGGVLAEQIQKLYDVYEPLRQATKDIKEQHIEEWKQLDQKDKPKVLFLSATPFAYHFNTDYAEGYLFDYPADKGKAISPRVRFLSETFGYELDSKGKLNGKFKKDVDVSALEVQFHENLRSEGALRGESLSIPADYNRGFIIAGSETQKGSNLRSEGKAIGAVIDEAFKALAETKEVNGKTEAAYPDLQSCIVRSFSGDKLTDLLEALKAQEAVRYAREYVKQGKKVVIIHRRKKAENLSSPLILPKAWKGGIFSDVPKDQRDALINRVKDQYEKFLEAHPLYRPIEYVNKLPDAVKTGKSTTPSVPYYLYAVKNGKGYDQYICKFDKTQGTFVWEKQNEDYITNNLGTMFTNVKTALATMQDEFKPGEALYFNGSGSDKEKEKVLEAFNSDNSKQDIFVGQIDACVEGLNLHDKTGKKQRVLINITIPNKPSEFVQVEGRIYRWGTLTNAMFRYITTGTDMETTAWIQRVAGKVATSENLAMGSRARGLLNSIREAFMETIDSDVWKSHLPGVEGEDVGGKAIDYRTQNGSPYDMAKEDYQRSEKYSKNQDKDGYYATPEPIGLKMVQWAGIKDGDKVLEPSAGHGAISRYFPQNNTRVILETDPKLATVAQFYTPDATYINGTFENYSTNIKFDNIVMTPPVNGNVGVEHVVKAYHHLRNGGRMVAMINDTPQQRKMLDAWLGGQGAQYFGSNDWYKEKSSDSAYIRQAIRMPSIIFERSTGKKIKPLVIIIDRLDGKRVADQPKLLADIKPIGNIYGAKETIEEIFNDYEQQYDDNIPERFVVDTSKQKEAQRAKDWLLDKFAPLTETHVFGNDWFAKMVKSIPEFVGAVEELSIDNRQYIGHLKEDPAARMMIQSNSEMLESVGQGIWGYDAKGKQKLSFRLWDSLKTEEDVELAKLKLLVSAQNYLRGRYQNWLSNDFQDDERARRKAVLDKETKKAEKAGKTVTTFYPHVATSEKNGKFYVESLINIENPYLTDRLLRQAQNSYAARSFNVRESGNGVFEFEPKSQNDYEDTKYYALDSFVQFCESWLQGDERKSIAEYGNAKAKELVDKEFEKVSRYRIEGLGNASIAETATRRSYEEIYHEAESAFPGAKFERTANGIIATLPNGARVKVSIKDNIILNDKQQKRALESHGVSKGTIQGYWKKFSADGCERMLAISQNSNIGTAYHEAMHAAIDLAMTEKEKQALYRYYEKQAKLEGRDVEETLADAYRDWVLSRQEGKGTIFGRLWRKFTDMLTRLKAFFDSGAKAESIFQKVESGSIYQRSYDREAVDRGRKMLAQIAYHGSAYDFDEFTLEHIGDGVGHQIHGWGLYFAREKYVADNYADRLGNGKGKSYSVDIPDNDVLLDEQEPYSKQPPIVKKAIKNVIIKGLVENDRKLMAEAAEGFRSEAAEVVNYLIGEKKYTSDDSMQKIAEAMADAVAKTRLRRFNHDLQHILGYITHMDDEQISKMLNAEGVKGIRYEDETDGYCFVVFDDKAIKIMDKLSKQEKKASTEKLLAPNGKASNLTPEQYKQVRTSEFKRWFGDWENDPKNASKVVDENGEPLVVYHGTRANFSIFDKKKINSGDGFWFNSNEETSKAYGSTEAVFLNIRNPLTYDADGKNWGALGEWVIKNKKTGEEILEDDVFTFEDDGYALEYLNKLGLREKDYDIVNKAPYDSTNNITYIAKEKGNDGVVVYNVDDEGPGNDYVVFEPNQIKSATKNNGKFSVDNDDIRYSVASADGISFSNQRSLLGVEEAGGIKPWMKQEWKKLYTDWIDKNHALHDLDMAFSLGLDRQLDENEKIYNKVQTLPATAAGMAQALVEGSDAHIHALNEKLGLKGDKALSLVSIAKVLKTIDAKKMDKARPDFLAAQGKKNWVDAFSQYLGYERLLEMKKISEAEGKEYKLPVAEQKIKQYIASAPEEFKRAATQYYLVNANMLKLMENAGLISEETRKLLNTKYKKYCPLMRDFSDTAAADSFIQGLTKGGKGIGNVSSMLKRISLDGSDRTILSPLESTVKAIAVCSNRCERNRIGQMAVNMAKDANGALDSVIRIVPGGKADAKNCIFTVMFDGKKVAYKTTQDLYGPIVGYNLPAAGMVLGLAKTCASVLRTGATTSLSFTLRNVLRDTIFAGISTQHSFTPFVDTIRGAYALWKNPKARAEFEAGGVTGFNFYNSAASNYNDLLKMNGKSIDWHKPSAIWEAIKLLGGKAEELSAFGESATRMGEFLKAREKGKSIDEAVRAARELTLDFSRSGVVGQNVNQYIPFFNATLQGGDKMIRLLHDDFLGTSAKLAEYIVIPSMILWCFNHDEDWYKELDPGIKNTCWCLPGGIRIPKPQEAGVLFGSGIEAMLDQAFAKDKRAVENWAKEVKAAAKPNIIPTVFLPLIEWQANYSFFRQGPLVPKRLQNMPDEMQYTNHTATLSKEVGKLTGLSPVKIDNTVRGYTGTMGMFLWQAGDVLEDRNEPSKKLSERQFIRDFNVNDQHTMRFVNDFYELRDAAEKQNTVHGVKGKPLADVVDIRKYNTIISGLNKDIQKITDSKTLSPNRKRELIDNKKARIKAVAKKAVEKYGNKYL